MSPIKAALTVLATGFAMWVAAGLWHNLIVPSFYAQAGHASHEGIGVLLIAYLILAGFMLTIYARAPGERSWRAGLGVGVFVGVLWVFPHELALAGAHGEPLAYVFGNAAWHAVEQGLGGLVLAAIAR